MPKLSSSAIVLILLLLCLAPTTAVASDPVHWGYDGEVGPEHWGTLSPEFAACSEGREQSPVDVPATAPVNPLDLRFDYHPSELNIVNNGHSIQVNYEPGSTLTVDGVVYELVQFHLHALSEHTLNGAHYNRDFHDPDDPVAHADADHDRRGQPHGHGEAVTAPGWQAQVVCQPGPYAQRVGAGSYARSQHDRRV